MRAARPPGAVCAERPELSPPAVALRFSPALRSASFDGESPWASLRGTRSRVHPALAARADTAGSTIRVSSGDSGGSQRVVRIVRSASRTMETGWTSFERHSTQKKSRRNQLSFFLSYEACQSFADYVPHEWCTKQLQYSTRNSSLPRCS